MITLRAGQPGSAVPREGFVTDLHRRLAAELARDPTAAPPAQARTRPAVDGTRRRLVQATSISQRLPQRSGLLPMVEHQLSTPPPALPQLETREAHGEVQVFALPGSV